jgi:hypothetical protein
MLLKKLSAALYYVAQEEIQIVKDPAAPGY